MIPAPYLPPATDFIHPLSPTDGTPVPEPVGDSGWSCLAFVLLAIGCGCGWAAVVIRLLVADSLP